MRTCAHWTARTVVPTARFAAASTGFSGAVFAASGCEGNASMASSPAASPLGTTFGIQGRAPGLASGPQRSGSTSDAWGRGSIGNGNQANAVAGAVALKMAGRRSRDRYYPRGCRV